MGKWRKEVTRRLLQLCLAHLEDARRGPPGDAFAGALGDLVAASKSPAALQAVCDLSCSP